MYGSQKITNFFVIAGFCLCVSIAEDVDCSKHPEHVDPKTCCTTPNFITDEMKEKCKEHLTPQLPISGEADDEKDAESTDSKPRPHHHHHHHHHHPPHHNPCFAECIFNYSGIVINNKVDNSKLDEHLNTIFVDEAIDMISVYQDAFETCVVKVEEFKIKMEERMKNNTRPTPSDKMARPHCNHMAGALMGCVTMQTFQNCAPSNWNDNQQCNDKRAFMKECHGHHGKGGKHGAGNSVEQN